MIKTRGVIPVYYNGHREGQDEDSYESTEASDDLKTNVSLILSQVIFPAVWSISMSSTFPRSCYGVSYAIKNQLVASKAPY